MTLRIIGIAALMSLGACAQQTTLYEWGSYSPSLRSYYKKPAELAEFSGKLQESLAKAEAAGKVPPGLYAEYGYVQLEMGNQGEALNYFAKERDRWPESAPFMTKLITRLSGKPAAEATPVAAAKPVM